ncbi:MAG: multicopper oxidase domain-containing protein [Acidobacteria bacterium]|nr:multicopper oxidase domain-containing protein [Acidobacteriota bacterium]
MDRLSRREFIGRLGTGAILGIGGASGFLVDVIGKRHQVDYARIDPTIPANFTTPLRMPSDQGLMGLLHPTGNVALTSREVDFEPFPGTGIRLWVYEASENGVTYQNPIFMIRRGERLTALLRNELPEPTILHWHGLRTDWKNDGHPSYEVGPGGTYPYDMNVENRGGTYWYHSHALGSTGKQVYGGLAGLFLVEDDEVNLRSALDLSIGETDVPLVIQDRRFNLGTLAYSPQEVDLVTGFIGDVILTNLTVNPSMDVSTRIYRYRILNASNARSFRLAFVNGAERVPFHIIGGDGGLLDRPYSVKEAFLAPGERLDVLLDFRLFREGDVLFLTSLIFDPMHYEFGSGPSSFPELSLLHDGEAFHILKLNVKRLTAYDRRIPDRLSDVGSVDTNRVAAVRNLIVEAPDYVYYAATQWRINSWSFRMDEFPVRVDRNTVEIWQLTSDPVGMPHPFHLHGFPFQVLQRRNSPEQIRRLAVDARGVLPAEKGWKDTVMVWPSETVRVAIDFSHHFPGDQDYLFDGQILEQQDEGMMINYKVV